MNLLVTGGAGFIGTHLVRRLVREGCTVTVLDNFSPQIHGDNRSLPVDLSNDVELQVGDIRDEEAVTRALRGQEVVVHLAAETGTGQSMYEVLRYEEVNIRGTAVLMQCIVNNSQNTIRKLVVASSRAVYGEGAYNCITHGTVYPKAREVADMLASRFEPRCPLCSSACQAVATSEAAPLQPSSFYGLTKQMQEQMILLFAQTLGLYGIALRYQNVYGPGQSLTNPYTGILAVFANRARLDEPLNIFEDGLESRDFVYIDDVVEATWRSITAEDAAPGPINVGSGERMTVIEISRAIVEFLGSQSAITVTGTFRQGDIRHNFADLQKARQKLGFEPQWKFLRGVRNFLEWAVSQKLVSDRYEYSLQEMRQRGFLHG
jgi:dTDP-L-rhamnose 4-epimerase